MIEMNMDTLLSQGIDAQMCCKIFMFAANALHMV